MAALIAVALSSCGGGAKTNNNQPPIVPPPTTGLDVRPSNVSCVAPARGAGGTSVDVTDAFPNLPNIVQPTKILLEPVANPRWFVLQKTGQIKVFDPDNAVSTSNYLTISPIRTASEGGLLGMAFHPDYPGTPEIFLYYTING
ncbi:MAG: PQQ-dependent sugar dehydrogenase, partial [Gammaproteobacteria bacterium]|nr:PQQ-dependent sugar dehydrogenase [Gammaproteobacteria bacterium]